MNLKLVFFLSAFLFLTSCLKTRSELGDNYQSQVYTKKQADNQKQQSLEPADTPAKIDEKDELIRALNGRVESLENQITQLQKDKQENPDGQKIQLLQDALTKMQADLEKLQTEAAAKAAAPPPTAPDTTIDKKAGVRTNFDLAQDYFAKKDFKNAILEYQKFIDANAKTKSKLIPEAKYKIGLSFESLGLKDEAQSFYEELAAQNSQTEFGKKAKQKLAKIKK